MTIGPAGGLGYIRARAGSRCARISGLYLEYVVSTAGPIAKRISSGYACVPAVQSCLVSMFSHAFLFSLLPRYLYVLPYHCGFGNLRSTIHPLWLWEPAFYHPSIVALGTTWNLRSTIHPLWLWELLGTCVLPSIHCGFGSYLEPAFYHPSIVALGATWNLRSTIHPLWLWELLGDTSCLDLVLLHACLFGWMY